MMLARRARTTVSRHWGRFTGCLAFASVAALLTTSRVDAQSAVTTPAPGAWPMNGHDPQRTSWAPGMGHLSANMSERFEYDVGGFVGRDSALIEDVNGDGVDEVVAIIGGKLVARDLLDHVVWDSPPLGLTALLAVADLNGDGTRDIVALRSNPAAVAVISERDGSLEWSQGHFDDTSLGVARGIALGTTTARVVNLTPTATAPRYAVALRVPGGDSNAHAFTFSTDWHTVTDAWNFVAPDRGWWADMLGVGDFDGDGTTDVAEQLNGRTIRLQSGAADAIGHGVAFPGTDYATDSVGQSPLAFDTERLVGTTNDTLYFFLPSSFGLINAAMPANSHAISYRIRDASAHGIGDQNLDVVLPVQGPVFTVGSTAYLAVNVFNDHDCEQATPNGAATCADLDGINDLPTQQQWHLAIFDAHTLQLVTQLPGYVGIVTQDIDGDGTPEILAQSAQSSYTVPSVTSMAALRLTVPASGTASLQTVWVAANSGLAGVITRTDALHTPTSSTPLIISSAGHRYLLLFQGDASSMSTGTPVALSFVDLLTGAPFSNLVFPNHVVGSPIGLVRTQPGLTAPDALAVSFTDGFFHLYTSNFQAPPDATTALGEIHSGGFITALAAGHLLGTNARQADLVATRSDGSLVSVPVANASLSTPPAETVRYYGGMQQYPLIVQSDDTPPLPRLIVGNNLGTQPYLAALSALTPVELWTSDPVAIPSGGTFLKFAPAVGDANGDGAADIFVGFDGTFTTGVQTFAGSQFYNVVSGRASGGTGTHHPLLWSQPYSPQDTGNGTCCWDNGAATFDFDGDGRDDLAIESNATMVIHSGNPAAATPYLYIGNGGSFVSPSNPSVLNAVQYGTVTAAHLETGTPMSLFTGAGPEGGWAVGYYNARPGFSLATHDTVAAGYSLVDFSEHTAFQPAVASFATPAAHGATDTLGVGIGSISGTFYALDPSMRSGTVLPLRYARCLHDGVSDPEPTTAIGTCTNGQTLSDAAAGDIDGDGSDEFVVGSQDGYLYALNAEDGSLSFAYNLHSSVGSPILADIDGDGTLGIYVSVGDGKIYAFGSASAMPLVQSPHVTAVSVTGGVPSAPTPGVMVSQSASLRYIAIAWGDPSTTGDTVYQTRVLTANGSPVSAWGNVMRSGTSPVIVQFIQGTYETGQTYYAEIAGHAPGSNHTDIEPTNTVLIINQNPPTVAPITVTTNATTHIAQIMSAVHDDAALQSETIAITNAAGASVFSVTHALSGTDVPVNEAWTSPDPTAGPFTVTITVQDQAGLVGTGTAMFSYNVALDGGVHSGDGGVDGGMTTHSGGCGCTTTPGSTSATAPMLALLAVVAGTVRRRRRV